MQSSAWIALLKKLPPEQVNQLALVTEGGTEFAVQSLLQMEGECLIFKGRLAGSQETGRLFYVPYDHIDYIGFYRFVADEEFRTWHGETPAPAAAENGAAAEKADTNGNGARPVLSHRAALLERIRSRPSSSGLNPTPPPQPPNR